MNNAQGMATGLQSRPHITNVRYICMRALARFRTSRADTYGSGVSQKFHDDKEGVFEYVAPFSDYAHREGRVDGEADSYDIGLNHPIAVCSCSKSTSGKTTVMWSVLTDMERCQDEHEYDGVEHHLWTS